MTYTNMSSIRNQAETLGLFFWIYSGLQAIFALFYIVIILIYGVSGVMMLVSARNTSDAAPAFGMMMVFVIFFVVILLLGVVSMVLNIRAGKQLRGEGIASKNAIMAASIGSIVSFICGGICILPFAIAMGVYGIWFAVSEAGNAYFSGHGNINPPPIQNYQFRS
jgi:hypothetical protein